MCLKICFLKRANTQSEPPVTNICTTPAGKVWQFFLFSGKFAMRQVSCKCQIVYYNKTLLTGRRAQQWLSSSPSVLSPKKCQQDSALHSIQSKRSSYEAYQIQYILKRSRRYVALWMICVRPPAPISSPHMLRKICKRKETFCSMFQISAVQMDVPLLRPESPGKIQDMQARAFLSMLLSIDDGMHRLGQPEYISVVLNRSSAGTSVAFSE